MIEETIEGRIHSFQSMGTLDGPGIRYVVFLSGCPLRCVCCHNPDTWDMTVGQTYTAKEIVSRAVRFKEYFGKDGGITVSGGEPLLQPEFVGELFALCKREGISTCLDTSGCLWNAQIEKMLAQTDRVLLDVKYTNEDDYQKYVGCSLSCVLSFLSHLNERKIKTTLRQVIIPTLNDTEENIGRLKKIRDAYPCVDRVELLPFRKICQVKYNSMGIAFPLSDTAEPSADTMKRLKSLL